MLGLGSVLGLVLGLIILGTLSRYYCAHSITPCLTVRYRNHTVIKYYILDPFYSGPMTSTLTSILKSTYYHSNPGRGTVELSA